MDLHEELLYTDVFTQAYSCMISDAFHATSVQQADVKPQFHRSLWRLRRIWWERVGQRKPIWQFDLIFWRSTFRARGLRFMDVNPRRVPLEKKIEKTFELVGLSTIRS